MNKKVIVLSIFVWLTGWLFATQTTYTFTKKDWSSKVGTVVTNKITDGWVSDKDAAADNGGGYTDANGLLYGAGVQVSKSYSGAGATSVVSFEKVRKIVVNYCSNNKDGAGYMVFGVGNVKDSIQITKPSSNGNYNRDVELSFEGEPSGKIQFSMKNTSGSFYINTITIKASNGSPNIAGLTADVFQLVTDVSQLQNGDEVMIGVSGNSHNYIMGLYDEWNSRNNIYAVKGSYSADRQTVNENADAVYTLLIGEKEGGGNYYALMDATDYYLVASGGNPNSGNNNYLTVWDTIYSSNYGWYGTWDITIAANGEASIVNLGKSRSGKLQFNMNGGTPIFACYSEWSMVMPALYRRVTIDDPTAPYLTASLCNFGTVLIQDASVNGQKTIEVNAINLTEEIQASLVNGSVFSLDKTELDRDGELLTVSYSATAVGDYRDTIVFKNSQIELRVSVLLNVDRELTIAEATTLSDLTVCYLNPVVITKKYDKYVFVRDDTGSMLLFDSGNLYAKDRKNGDVLTGVVGKYKNYYGNPDLNLTAQFNYKAGDAALPDVQTTMPDSADVCRYLRFEKVQYNSQKNLVVNGEVLPIYDLFNYQSQGVIQSGIDYTIEGIVYYYNEVVFCPTSIEIYVPTGLAETYADTDERSVEKRIVNGEVIIFDGETEYDVQGRER